MGTDFYTAGVEGTKAVIWKNSTLQRLPTLIGNSSAAFSVVAQGTDVYAVGYESNGNVAIARVWKNGNPINLTDGITSGRATSIFVSGSDIYIVGTQENKIKIWKNNILANTIQGGYLPYNGNCIYVSGNDVYVCGSGAISSSNQNSVAKVWKNGVLTNLTNGTTSAYASAVFVFENDVYVAGVEANSLGIQVGKVWKNGVATNLTDGTRFANIKSIFIK